MTSELLSFKVLIITILEPSLCSKPHLFAPRASSLLQEPAHRSKSPLFALWACSLLSSMGILKMLFSPMHTLAKMRCLKNATDIHLVAQSFIYKKHNNIDYGCACLLFCVDLYYRSLSHLRESVHNKSFISLNTYQLYESYPCFYK